MGDLSRTSCLRYGTVLQRTGPGAFEPGPSRSLGGEGPSGAADCGQHRFARSLTPCTHTLRKRSTTSWLSSSIKISRLNQLTMKGGKAVYLSNNNKTAAQEHLTTDYTIATLAEAAQDTRNQYI